MENIRTYNFNNLKLAIYEENGKINEIAVTKKPISKGIESNVLELAKQQLSEYFSGIRQAFNLPLNITGTPFQIKVWQQLSAINYAETTTYKNISEKINHPKSYRAVGSACNKNNFLIVVPCHRVVGSNNSLVGYAEGLDLKQHLLELEKNFANNFKS